MVQRQPPFGLHTTVSVDPQETKCIVGGRAGLQRANSGGKGGDSQPATCAVAALMATAWTENPDNRPVLSRPLLA